MLIFFKSSQIYQILTPFKESRPIVTWDSSAYRNYSFKNSRKKLLVLAELLQNFSISYLSEITRKLKSLSKKNHFRANILHRTGLDSIDENTQIVATPRDAEKRGGGRDSRQYFKCVQRRRKHFSGGALWIITRWGFQTSAVRLSRLAVFSMCNRYWVFFLQKFSWEKNQTLLW